MSISVFPIQPAAQDPSGPAIIGDRVELQLLTTLRCNLKCTYCSAAVGGVIGSQGDVSYTPDMLDAFIEKHLRGYDVYVTFYGGEPTLNREFMREVMARHPGFRYQLQTNGTLIDGLPDEVLGKLSNILVSIDGGESITDMYRGRGIYRQVMKNIERVRGRVGGSITARVTWSNPETSFEEIDHLTRVFDYVYFQFAQAEGGYEPEAMEAKRRVLVRLIDAFFAHDGLYRVIPLMGIVRNKLMPEKIDERYAGLTQCRVSTHLINVMPDGRIFPCPDLLYMPEMQQGDLKGNWLRRSPLQPHADMPCEQCEAFSWCRRNCMKNLHLAYVKKDEAYRSGVVEPICDLVRFIGHEIDRHDPQAWYARQNEAVRAELADCPVYEYVEIMP